MKRTCVSICAVDMTIVIPCLNEEGSVGQVAQNCLHARELVTSETPVDKVNVVVVSDGSTDRTVEIARAIPGITTIVFRHNRGYGAAIQEGWRVVPADLLAFLDGDGTCDPRFFVPLIKALEGGKADVALGNRMSPNNQMPRIRRLGNWLYATLLGLLSKRAVRDSASGMRVVRKASLSRLLPLPAGLHFTPAMSARALMDEELKIEEVDMPYAERVGRSKLSLVKDGLRFLHIILSTVAFLRPARLTLPVVGVLVLVSIAIGIGPTIFFVSEGRLEEWMIYRFLFISMLANVGVMIFCLTLVAEHVVALGLLRYRRFLVRNPWWWGKRGFRFYLGTFACLVILGIYLVFPGFQSFVTTGRIAFETMHWSRVVLAGFFGITFAQIIAARLLVMLLESIEARQTALVEGEE